MAETDATIQLETQMSPSSPSTSPPTLQEVARARIRNWLRATGTTQTQLAAKVGKTQAWLSRYLSGGLDADLESLKLMAETFGHSLTALLETPADPVEARVIALFRALRPEGRDIVLKFLEYWAHPPVHKKPSKSRG